MSNGNEALLKIMAVADPGANLKKFKKISDQGQILFSFTCKVRGRPIQVEAATLDEVAKQAGATLKENLKDEEESVAALRSIHEMTTSV
jgi:hypothetical protein